MSEFRARESAWLWPTDPTKLPPMTTRADRKGGICCQPPFQTNLALSVSPLISVSFPFSLCRASLICKFELEEFGWRETSYKDMSSRRVSHDDMPTGFRMSAFVKEHSRNAIFSVAWSTDVFHDECPEKDANSSPSATILPRQVRYMATCAANLVSLYEVEIPTILKNKKKTLSASPVILRQAYVDPDADESFYACAFGGRSLGLPFGYTPVKDDNGNVVMETVGSSASDEPMDSCETEECKRILRSIADTSLRNGPQLLCVAGVRGIIKVIDTVQQLLLMTLSGHGNEIYDLKFSPTNEWLLLSASKDESVRLWNLKTATCVAMFAGHEGHRDSVLTVSWHSSGNRFASGSMDNTIKLWNLGPGTKAYEALQASHSLEPIKWDTPITAPPTSLKFKAAYEQMPYYSSNKIHHNYVDCVQFVGDLVISKSVHNTIVLWKPDFSPPIVRGRQSHWKPPNGAIVLCEFTIRDCNVWFIRFDVTANGKLLAIGNGKGEIKLWNIDDNPNKKCFSVLTHAQCTSMIRMVSFCPDSTCLVAVCEDGSVWKWDATYS